MRIPRSTMASSLFWAAIVVLAIGLAQGLSYTFVWTYVAGYVNVRGSFTQDVSFCITVCALFTALVLQIPPPTAGVREWSRRPWVPIGVFVGILAVGCLRDTVIWGKFDSARIAWNGLIVAPLGMVLFVAVNATLGRLQPGRRMLRVAAVMTGVSVSHGLLAEAGSIWVYAIVCVIAVGMLLVVETWPNRNPEEAVKTLILGIVTVQLMQIAFGSFPLGWDVAVLFTFSLSCWVVARAAAGVANLVSRHNAVSLVGTVESVAVRPWYDRFDACKLLPFGWVVVLFHAFCWTEPEEIIIPLRPQVIEISEASLRGLTGTELLNPKPMLPTGAGSLSEAAAAYSAQWDRYNAIEFENWLQRLPLEFPLMSDNALKNKEREPPTPILVGGMRATHPAIGYLEQASKTWNKKEEITGRQFTKVITWVFMLFSTFLWWSGRSVRSTKPIEAGAEVSAKMHDELAREDSVTLGQEDPGVGLLSNLAPAKVDERVAG